MTPRSPLTPKGILFLAGKTLEESRQHQVVSDSRAMCDTQGEEPLAAPILFQQRQLQFPARRWRLPRNPLSLEVHLPAPAGRPHLGFKDPQGSHPKLHYRAQVRQTTWSENEILNMSNSNLGAMAQTYVRRGSLKYTRV